MKKQFSILMTLIILAVMLTPLSAAAVISEPNEFSVIYSADGDNVPAKNAIGKDGGNSVSAVSAKGGLGKDENDTYIKMNIVGTASGFIYASWGDNSQHTNNVWYKSSYDGYVICEAEIYSKDGFENVKLATDQNAKVSNNITGLEANKWYHVAFVIDCDGNGNESTQAYINGVPFGQPCTDGVLGENRGSAGSFRARNDLRMHFTLPANSAGEFYVDNLCYYETDSHVFGKNLDDKENALYSWNGSAGTINDSIYISRSPENAVGGKMSGDISDHVTDVDKGDGGVPYIEYLWGEAEQNCSDEADAAAKWTKGSFVGYLVTEVNVLNNGKLGDFSIRTGGNQPVSNAVDAAALKEGWNKLAVVIENKAAEDGSIVRTAREYVNGEEIIPENDETVMLGKFNSSDKYCMNELRLVFKGEGANGGDLDIYIDDISIYETDSEPILDKPITVPGGHDAEKLGFMVDNTSASITVREGKTVADILGLVAESDARAAVYTNSRCKVPLKGSEPLSKENVLIIENAENSYSRYIIKLLAFNEISFSGDGYSGGMSLNGGQFTATAIVKDTGVLLIAQYGKDNKLLKCRANASPDRDGVLSLDYIPEDVTGSTVCAMLLKDTDLLSPLCDVAELEYNPIDILIVENSSSVDVSAHLREIAAAAGDDYNVAGNAYLPGSITLDSAACSDAKYSTGITAMQTYKPLTPEMCSTLQKIVDNMER